jgi:hypothetical protein
MPHEDRFYDTKRVGGAQGSLAVRRGLGDDNVVVDRAHLLLVLAIISNKYNI